MALLLEAITVTKVVAAKLFQPNFFQNNDIVISVQLLLYVKLLSTLLSIPLVHSLHSLRASLIMKYLVKLLGNFLDTLQYFV